MSERPTETFPVEQLSEFCAKVLQSFEVPKADAQLATGVLMRGDLRGIESHGIARLSSYCQMLGAGRINPKPNLTIVRETPGTATIDGDNGLGLVIAPKANEITMDKAEAVGTSWVSVSNTNHYGIAGYYVLEALERDQIGWSMTNTTPVVTPLWGAERMLGTNPIAIAFPGKEEPPIVIDMATTPAAFGKIEIAKWKGKPIPEGWAIGGDGRSTTDPEDMIEHGCMLPLGFDRERGAHKGFCLSALVDLLCGPLGGASWGPFTPPFALRYPDPVREVGKGLGHLLGAMRIDAFIDVDEFKRQIDDWIRTFRNAKPAPGTNGPLIPGDPEREAEQIRQEEGIPLLVAVADDLRQLSQQTGIPFE